MLQCLNGGGEGNGCLKSLCTNVKNTSILMLLPKRKSEGKNYKKNISDLVPNISFKVRALRRNAAAQWEIQ